MFHINFWIVDIVYNYQNEFEMVEKVTAAELEVERFKGDQERNESW